MVTRDEIIRQALINIRKIDPSSPLTPQEIEDGATALNNLMLSWAVLGITLWTQGEREFNLEAGNGTYQIGMSEYADITEVRPIKVKNVSVRDPETGISRILLTMRESELMSFADRAAEGIPRYFLYRPTIPDGTLVIYPAPAELPIPEHEDESPPYALTYFAIEPVDLTSSGSDSPSVPDEWVTPMIDGLSAMLGPGYGLSVSDAITLSQQAIAAAKAISDRIGEA